MFLRAKYGMDAEGIRSDGWKQTSKMYSFADKRTIFIVSAKENRSMVSDFCKFGQVRL